MKRVLVVDDNPMWREKMKDLAEGNGAVVETAKDGLEGYNKAFEFVPDVVFADAEMPLLRGYTLCRILKNEPAFKETGIIVMTGLDETLNKFWAIKSGADGFLKKTDSPEELERAVKEYIENPSFKANAKALESAKPKPIYEINLLLEKLLLKETIKNEIYTFFNYIADEDHIMWKLSDLIFQLVPADLVAIMVLDPLLGRLFVASRESGKRVNVEEIKETLFAVFERPVIPVNWKLGGNVENGGEAPLLIPFVVKNTQEIGVIGVEAVNLQMEDLEILVEIAMSLGVLFETTLTYSTVVTQARIDELTGLLNYRTLMEKLSEYFSVSKRNRDHFSVGMFDIDDFKKVNDTFGHLMGNEVLKTIAKIMKESFREIDVVGRYGGEEFTVGLVGADIDDAYGAMERFRKNVESFDWSSIHPDLRVTVSGGVSSTSVKDYRSVVEMIEDADKALYVSKKEGKNRITKAVW